jgi:hypothetical protein
LSFSTEVVARDERKEKVEHELLSGFCFDAGLSKLKQEKQPTVERRLNAISV